jgi:hypothetical protein
VVSVYVQLAKLMVPLPLLLAVLMALMRSATFPHATAGGAA